MEEIMVRVKWEYLREIFKFVLLGCGVVLAGFISYLVLRRRPGIDRRADGNIDELRGRTARATNWSRDIEESAEGIDDGLNSIEDGAGAVTNGAGRIENGIDKIRGANRRLALLIDRLRGAGGNAHVD